VLKLLRIKFKEIKKPALAVTSEASYYPAFTGGVDRTANRLPSQHKHPPLNLIKEKTIALPVSHQAGSYILSPLKGCVNKIKLLCHIHYRYGVTNEL
jgi:hypothetical protein